MDVARRPFKVEKRRLLLQLVVAPLPYVMRLFLGPLLLVKLLAKAWRKLQQLHVSLPEARWTPVFLGPPLRLLAGQLQALVAQLPLPQSSDMRRLVAAWTVILHPLAIVVVVATSLPPLTGVVKAGQPPLGPPLPLVVV